MEACDCGGTGGSKGTADGTVSGADGVIDEGTDGRCCDWRCKFAIVNAGTSAAGVGGGGTRVELSIAIEDQPPVRNAGAG